MKAGLDDIWVDTDPTLGSAWSDIDDALAVELVARRGRLSGVSSVFGNGPLAITHPTATALARRFAVPVARGAKAPGPRRSVTVQPTPSVQ
jgi:inosine-uridine nucleoside N-ribohydrolase